MGIIEEDYLLRLINQIVQIIMQSRTIAEDVEHPRPLESAQQLEEAISDLVGVDADTLLALSPRSLAEFINFLELDQDTLHILANMLALEASYLAADASSDNATSALRLQQAQRIAGTYNLVLDEDPTSLSWLEPYGRRIGTPINPVGEDEGEAPTE